MSISDDLFWLAGLFERYRKTGGTFTAEEAAAVSGKLAQLAEGSAAQADALKSLGDEFDRYVEDQHRDLPAGAVTRCSEWHGFGVIEGGRA